MNLPKILSDVEIYREFMQLECYCLQLGKVDLLIDLYEDRLKNLKQKSECQN